LSETGGELLQKKETTMNSEIFREYDIRGIAGKDMTEDDVVLIGKGVGTYLLQHGSSKLIIIAYF